MTTARYSDIITSAAIAIDASQIKGVLRPLHHRE
jgi:hypothetical protein